MKKTKKIPDNQIAVYQTPEGGINIEVLYANENIWLPQKRMAELFDVDRTFVTRHLGNIFLENELQKDTVCAKFVHTAEDFSIVQIEGEGTVLSSNFSKSGAAYTFTSSPANYMKANGHE